MALSSDEAFDLAGDESLSYPISLSEEPAVSGGGGMRGLPMGLTQTKEADPRVIERIRTFRNLILSAVELPNHIKPDEVIARVVGIDRIPPRVKLQRRFDANSARLDEARLRFKESLSGNDPLSTAREWLATELKGTVERERMRDHVRRLQQRYTFYAIARGEIPHDVCLVLIDDLAWEGTVRGPISTGFLKPLLKELAKAVSRKELNEIALRGRSQIARLTNAIIPVMLWKERVVLSLEAWNSAEASLVYKQKPWTRLPPTVAFRESIQGLASALRFLPRAIQPLDGGSTQWGVRRLASSAAAAQLALNLFQPLVQESRSE
jgi:hypothetical protein